VADVFMVSQVSAGEMLSVAERIRDALPDIDLAVALSGGSLRSQFKRADRSGARWCVILGEAEFSRGQVSIKDLRGADAAQEDVALDALPARLQALLAPDRND
jgi:histidyl-tRNA synthetase